MKILIKMLEMIRFFIFSAKISKIINPSLEGLGVKTLTSKIDQLNKKTCRNIAVGSVPCAELCQLSMPTQIPLKGRNAAMNYFKAAK